MGNFWILPIMQSLSEMFIAFTGRGDAHLLICGVTVPQPCTTHFTFEVTSICRKQGLAEWYGAIKRHGRSVRLHGLESCQPRRYTAC